MAKIKNCSTCGVAFQCGADDAAGNCWCNSLPNIISPDEGPDCLCPDCLAAKINALQAKERANSEIQTD